MTQKKIIEQLHLAFSDVENTARQFSVSMFFQKPVTGKWSAAENVEHLILSVKPLAGLFSKPETMVEKWGKTTRPQRNYDKVVAAYLEKVGDVGAGFPDFMPRNAMSTKQERIDDLNAINNKFLARASLLTEPELDTYQVPHPLIGMLTCREFLYFTHYHTIRHCGTMKQLLEERS